ncbi:uncharacterized protein EAF01_007976 [Botrytis porri]|uniref:Uncharacterized protein n=1 Tax=Botrytis porri TaxID=87229 RepID=A0A4Z1K9E4_9HELO|nr:uncharacterized protein EAF01_007976 [Botrytis porri]KAF7900674.1 hypothetical protein EAF01_007976 [Botrytis porri]TGO82617.1 hypothetical protein BPOR_0791g00040 [Botrytis porri]
MSTMHSITGILSSDSSLSLSTDTTTNATNNYESTEQVEIAAIFHEDVVQEDTTDEKAAKKPEFEDTFVKWAIEKDVIGENNSEEDTVHIQMNLLLRDINMEDDAKRNNTEEADIAETTTGIVMDNSSDSDPDQEFEDSGAYYHIRLKIDGGAIDEEVVKVESEDDDDGQFLA